MKIERDRVREREREREGWGRTHLKIPRQVDGENSMTSNSNIKESNKRRIFLLSFFSLLSLKQKTNDCYISIEKEKKIFSFFFQICYAIFLYIHCICSYFVNLYILIKFKQNST